MRKLLAQIVYPNSSVKSNVDENSKVLADDISHADPIVKPSCDYNLRPKHTHKVPDRLGYT